VTPEGKRSEGERTGLPTRKNKAEFISFSGSEVVDICHGTSNKVVVQVQDRDWDNPQSQWSLLRYVYKADYNHALSCPSVQAEL